MKVILINHRFSFAIFWMLTSVIYSLIFWTIEFSDFPINGLNGIVTLCMQFFVGLLAISGVVGLMLIDRWICAVSIPVLMVISTVLAYFKITLGASLTPAVIELWSVTGLATSMDLISISLIVYVLGSLLISGIVVWFRWRKVESPSHKLLWLGVFIILLCISKIPRCESAIYARAPFSIYASIKGYFEIRKISSETRNTYDNVAVTNTVDSLEVIMILGESLRADHLGFNGYERMTTPHLSREKNIVSLTDVFSDPIFTHTSVPFILTSADERNPESSYEEQSFISIFKRGSFSTSWVSNQEDSNTYTYFMYEADTLIRNEPSINLYNFRPHMDSELLPHISALLSASCPLKLIVVHTIGSHWWYGCHFDETFPGNYFPIARSKVLSENTKKEMVNSYDNTILATDSFISDVIDKLRDKTAILIYQSDHGESLGEDGRFLHGTDAPELHYPAAFIWFSDKYSEKFPEKINALQRNATKRITTSYVFHSILDAAGFSVAPMDTTLSIFR